MTQHRNRKLVKCIAIMVACIAAVWQIAAGAGLATSARNQAFAMLRGVREETEQNYFDPTYGGVNLAVEADLAKVRISKAVSIDEALAAIAQFTLTLDDSHTKFIPPRLNVDVEYGWEMGMIGDRCYITRVKPDSDAARQGVDVGDALVSVNGYIPDRNSIWRIRYLFEQLRPQPGLHLELITPAGVSRQLDLAGQVKKKKQVLDLTGSDGGADRQTIIQESERHQYAWQPQTVESIPGVLIYRLPSFNVSAREIQRLFQLVRTREVLILDLRGNGGGPLAILKQLLGGLTPVEITIGSIRLRNSVETVVTKGAGKYAFAGRLFILIDGGSASASETIARAVQLMNRGTLIGDRSAGAVMVGQYRPRVVNDGEKVIDYGAYVTIADVVMSDGGRLEKKGVEPDFKVLPTADDLAAGRDPALAMALKFAGHKMDATAAGLLLPRRSDW